MGFFSNLKNKARRQIAPVMPMAPQPLPRVPVMPQKPRMPEALPPRSGTMSRGLPRLMNQMQGGPRRMMMKDGEAVNMVDFLNANPQQQIFGIETRIGILENQLEEALANNDRQSYDMIVDQINDADAQRINIMNSMNPMNSRMMLGESGRTISNMDRATLDDILEDLEKKN
jgi:hypothetical protein